MTKKRKMYRIMYRPDNVQTWVESIDLAGRSKAEVLMKLVNYTIVYHIQSVERIKDE